MGYDAKSFNSEHRVDSPTLDKVFGNTNYCKPQKIQRWYFYLIALYFAGISVIVACLCITPCCALSALPHKLLRTVSRSLTSPAQHLFSVAVVQGSCLPYCLGLF